MPLPGRTLTSTPGVSPPLFPDEWHAFPDEESMSRAAAVRLAAELRVKPAALVCLATGASPKRTYELLVAQAHTEPSLCLNARWMKLDEWGGLAMNDPATCETFLRREIIEPLQVPPHRYFGWESQPANPNEECERVSAWLAKNGPIDLLVLGLGENGHLGFNEPGDAFISGPHVAQLTPESLSHSMLQKSRGQVSYGLTLGMDNLLAAKRIILLVSGTRKARQLHRLLSEKVTPQFPASLLRRHPAVAVYCDHAAALLLRDGNDAATLFPNSAA